jgi:hypothetical protein
MQPPLLWGQDQRPAPSAFFARRAYDHGSAGVTRSYQNVYAKISAIPFADKLKLDVDGYAIGKVLDVLFYMVAKEGRKIPEVPFGSSGWWMGRHRLR